MRWTICRCLLVVLSLVAVARGAEDAARGWRTFYENGHWDMGAQVWAGKDTHSQKTPDGLLVADSSTENWSIRFYELDWNADPRQGAAVEARVKVAACSGPQGVVLMAADGVHEEWLTLYPHHLQLENAKQGVDFDAAGGFHTYRLEIQATDVRLFVDGKLLIAGSGKFTVPAGGKPPSNQCGFGCNSSPATGEATWQWVKCQGGSLTPPLPQIAGLKVTVGETRLISPAGDYKPNIYLKKLRNFRSGAYAIGTCAFEFTDGEIISPAEASSKVRDGVFEVAMARSTDGGKTFNRESARLNIPEGTGGMGDDGKYCSGPTVDHAIVQLRDGSLLMTVYGYFKTDTVVSYAFPAKWNFHMYRTWVMRSTDRGRTWDYLATVAYDPKIGSEGYCEPDLLVLPNRDILCFMRTGGVGVPKGITPMYVNVSKDDGKTWSKPVRIADRGVWPCACRMQSGVLALTYGRPGNWLVFSRDQGKTWIGHYCFYHGRTSSYNSVAEVAPGKLLVVYDHPGVDADGNEISLIAGMTVDVKAE